MGQRLGVNHKVPGLLCDVKCLRVPGKLKIKFDQVFFPNGY